MEFDMKDETAAGSRDDILKDKLKRCFENFNEDVLKMPDREFVEWLKKDLAERWGTDEESEKSSQFIFKRPDDKDIVDATFDYL